MSKPECIKPLVFHRHTTPAEFSSHLGSYQSVSQYHAKSRRMADLMQVLGSRTFTAAVEGVKERQVGPLGMYARLQDFLVETKNNNLDLAQDDVGYAWTVYLCRQLQAALDEELIQASLEGASPLHVDVSIGLNADEGVEVWD